MLAKLDPTPQWSAIGLPFKVLKAILLMAADVKVRRGWGVVAGWVAGGMGGGYV